MADAKILTKALAILERLATSQTGETAADLAVMSSLHRTSVYRYLNTFVEMGYVSKDQFDRYHLGTKILELSSHMLRRMPIREVAHPFLVELSAETEETVHLCVLDKTDIVYIDKIENLSSLPLVSRIGSRAPAYCTASGKVLLSSYETDTLIGIFQDITMAKRTANTITDLVQLLEEIKATKTNGYAIDNEEHEEGIKCFSAPIRGQGEDIVGAISLTGRRRIFDQPEIETAMLCRLTETARKVSRALGSLSVSS
jgi:IclR family transcriptional regulator, KDG regulon repressor